MKAIMLIVVLVGCGFEIDGNGTSIGPDASDALDTTLDAQTDACVPQPRELLANGSFDTTPKIWIETAPIITDQDLVGDTAPNVAKLGALDTSDALYQTIQIPDGTTNVILTGKFQVRTSEPTSIAHDTARIDLEGVPVALFELDNRTPTTGWETFVAPINASPGIKLLTISSTNDEALATSFYFDSLSLTAMVCP